MMSYLARRLLSLVPVLFAVSTLVFALLHLMPGDPVDLMLGEQALAIDRVELTQKLHLDQPLMTQYVGFLKGLVIGDWGTSIFDGRPVSKHIGDRFGATLLLSVCAMWFAIAISIPVGILAARKKGKMLDSLAMFVSLVGISLPNFWLGPVLILIFSVKLGILPFVGREHLASLLLPSITLGAALAAMLSRITRSSMLEELHREYITTARAKGVREWKVVTKHALRNALNPVITVIGLQVGTLLAGTIVTEKIFSWPGMGSLLLDAIHRRDYPVVQGVILVNAFIYVVVNALTDIAYKMTDPRVDL
ncbi:MAG: ABC transporter permease [Deltaproteobacteria bacterium]|nr:ABC transporter permease [Deltaproteobacteria bacterium]